jgi:hypothetical protein
MSADTPRWSAPDSPTPAARSRGVAGILTAALLSLALWGCIMLAATGLILKILS